MPASRRAGPRPRGCGTSATIATSARLIGPNSGANVGSRSTASVSLTMLLRTLAGSCAPPLATNASAAAAQASFGKVGRCSSSPWVSVPRRKRPSAASAVGGRMGGSARSARLPLHRLAGRIGLERRQPRGRQRDRGSAAPAAPALWPRPAAGSRRSKPRPLPWRARAWPSGRSRAARRRARPWSAPPGGGRRGRPGSDCTSSPAAARFAPSKPAT